MTAKQTNPRFALRRELGRMIGISLAVAAALAALLALTGWAAHLLPMVAAGGVCMIGGVVALLAMAWRAAACEEGVVQGAMIGIMARLGICLAGAAALVAATGWGRDAVAGWTLGWYLLMLLLDADAMLRYTRRREGGGDTGDASNARSAPMREVRA